MHLTPNKRKGLIAAGALAAGALTVFVAEKAMAKSTGPSGAAGGQTVTATDKDNGKSFSLQVGDKLQVALPVNPSSGGTWTIGGNDYTVLAGNAAPQFQAASNAPGAGGSDVFTFTAIKAGTAKLVFVLTGPGGQVVTTVNFTATVASKDGSAAPPARQVQMYYAPTAQLTPGQTYVIATKVDTSQIPNKAALVQALQGAGWQNATVLFFGPAGDPATAWPDVMPWPLDRAQIPTMYVASGTYQGAASPAPQGVAVYQMIPAQALPIIPTVIDYKGSVIAVAQSGQLFIGNAICGKNPQLAFLAIGTSSDEVVAKLANDLDANCK